jgi:hypothetical protein
MRVKKIEREIYKKIVVFNVLSRVFECETGRRRTGERCKKVVDIQMPERDYKLLSEFISETSYELEKLTDLLERG